VQDDLSCAGAAEGVHDDVVDDTRLGDELDDAVPSAGVVVAGNLYEVGEIGAGVDREIVSKSLPHVSITTAPENAAVQRYQIDVPPATARWFGSPASAVASTVDPVVVPAWVVSGSALAKLSLGGGTAAADADRMSADTASAEAIQNAFTPCDLASSIRGHGGVLKRR
jgi:hypothetical protein